MIISFIETDPHPVTVRTSLRRHQREQKKSALKSGDRL